MPVKKATKTDVKPAPQLFVKAPEKTAEAKKREANKGKESWRHKATTGKAHPDNKPPLQIVAEPSPENKKKYEDSINAEREKEFASGTDWRDLEGGVPQDESDAPKPEFPKGAKEASNP